MRNWVGSGRTCARTRIDCSSLAVSLAMHSLLHEDVLVPVHVRRISSHVNIMHINFGMMHATTSQWHLSVVNVACMSACHMCMPRCMSQHAFRMHASLQLCLMFTCLGVNWFGHHDCKTFWLTRRATRRFVIMLNSIARIAPTDTTSTHMPCIAAHTCIACERIHFKVRATQWQTLFGHKVSWLFVECTIQNLMVPTSTVLAWLLEFKKVACSSTVLAIKSIGDCMLSIALICCEMWDTANPCNDLLLTCCRCSMMHKSFASCYWAISTGTNMSLPTSNNPLPTLSSRNYRWKCCIVHYQLKGQLMCRPIFMKFNPFLSCVIGNNYCTMQPNLAIPQAISLFPTDCNRARGVVGCCGCYRPIARCRV